ncbi:hypothetical protein SISSUDRAFT_1050685 [Sistotremastrum suecicum HHB10207 ss-3]|uniref:Extracellular metalloproteinase n=1 Tax=Sistotremastrum suecicum HHB10207 ss-3 TaxID=1314776 RepID=A0A166B110_9AGAM|nr:hypothetical protein SISSUDRAFT_1050685 [Sistotremastrum suecicum HHB10207 ss-3]
MLPTGLISLALLLAGSVHGRKTMGWGHTSSEHRFVVHPQVPASFLAEDAAPFDVARQFMNHIYPGDYRIRQDSYTDKATGVTHVYVKQQHQGFDVFDGNININIKDGKVLSYGDSFYKGTSNREGSQVVLNSFAADPSSPADLRKTLMNFMIIAAPSDRATSELEVNFSQYLEGIEVTPESHFVEGEQPYTYFSNVPTAVSPVKGKPGYVQTESGLKFVWKFEVEMEDNWYEVALTPDGDEIPFVVDWAADSPIPDTLKSKDPKPATYLLFPWGVNDPSEGNRSYVYENYDSLASPLGWHKIPASSLPSGYFAPTPPKKGDIVNFTTTFGNNVFAHENWEGRNAWLHNERPDGGKGLNFSYPYDPQQSADGQAEAHKFINNTVAQLFYTSNLVHDLFYRYGFDELSGNFQQHNFGRGGAEGDAVIANAQDGSGYNNANFMTPPDGQNGRCRMYLWNTASPYRDGDLEAGIVIHELAHGLSTRLTGGPRDSSCLGWGESGGMGEGWGDFLATIIRTHNATDEEIVLPMGAWAANRDKGIRNYPYSTSLDVNPSTYKTLDRPGYFGVHAIGEVWAEILWVVSKKLIAVHNSSDTLFPPKPLDDGTIPSEDFYLPPSYDNKGRAEPLVPIHGNSLIVQLVLNGMKLQPCRPSFFDARDAIIQADEILTGGNNTCLLWSGFAERGLGPDARVDGRTPWGGGIRTNDYSVPLSCITDEPEPTPDTL